MGFAKDQMMQEDEQGWDFVDEKFVCSDCFTDPCIKQYVEDNAEALECDYCGRSSEEPIAADLNEVLSLLGRSIYSEWSHAIRELPYESAEGGYQGDTLDSNDLMAAIDDPFANDALREDVSGAFSDHGPFCQLNYLSLPEDKALVYGWQDFCEVVKHQRRYFFATELPGPEDELWHDRDVPSPSKILDRIASVVVDTALIQYFPGGTTFYRAREGRFSTGSELGSPPKEYATASNRMSPAGIPMFYGARDPDTAAEEVIRSSTGKVSTLTIGRFETERYMRLLNLAEIPPVPSLFDDHQRDLRSALTFLAEFAIDLAKPIKKDGREHIEYVPTQIVTEYFRHVFRDFVDRPVDGILYRSSHKDDGICCVLFCENEQCVHFVVSRKADPGVLLCRDPGSIEYRDYDDQYSNEE